MPERGSAEGDVFLAFDLGATNLRCGLVDEHGALLVRDSVPTPPGPMLALTLRDLAERVRGSIAVRSAVVGVPGRVDYTSGSLAWGRRQPAEWRETLTESALGRLLGMPVALANDADLATVGEATFGAGSARPDVVYITLSSGVGAGAVVGGRLLRSRVKLCEIGLTLLALPGDAFGEPTVLEDVASGRGLEAQARRMGLGGSAAEIVERVREGDALAKRLWEGYARAVAVAVVNLAHLLVPEVVIIGGGLSRSGELLLAPVREWLERHGPQDLSVPIELATAALSDDAGLAGAAAWGRATRELWVT